MKISVCVVQPLYQINLGYIARAMKNFGVKNLYLVKPRCNHLGKKAIMYSKHARSVLENAKIVGSIDEARLSSKSSIVVGTTGIWQKSSQAFYNVQNPVDFAKCNKSKSVLIVLGRDDTGLTSSEMMSCDATVFIEADSAYPVLNISHALAIILYEFTRPKTRSQYSFESFAASSRTKASIIKLFSKIVDENAQIRDKKAVKMAFSHVISRSMPTEKELRALMIALHK